MPWDLASLKQAITDWSENPEATFVANLPNIIKMAEVRINETVPIVLFRGTVAGHVYDNNPTPNLIIPPADMLAPFALWMVDPDTGWETPVKNKDEEFRRVAYPLNYKTGGPPLGRPRWYSFDSPYGISVTPSPNKNYLWALAYLRRQPSIVDQTSTWLGTNAEDVLFFACMKNASVFMKGEPELTKTYDDMYREAVQNLLATGQGRARKDWHYKPDKRIET